MRALFVPPVEGGGMEIIMRYLIIGAGGTGGILGAYMTKAGKDVTLIARNAHLAAMKEHGLTLRHLWDGTVETIPVQAENMESYENKIKTAGEAEKPDVILVCVKGYSLDSTVPFIQKIAKKTTIVIPILNIYGTGGRLQEKLPGILVTDGCIYVSANIEGPGALAQHEKILRVVFGVREKNEFREELKEIAKDLRKSRRTSTIAESPGNSPKISDGMPWKNSPMYPQSVRQVSTIMPRRRISRERVRSVRRSRQ